MGRQGYCYIYDSQGFRINKTNKNSIIMNSYKIYFVYFEYGPKYKSYD